MLKLGTLIQFTSPVNGQEFRGVICGYPPGEDTYDVAHGGHIRRMTTNEFTVIRGPCDDEIAALKAQAIKPFVVPRQTEWMAEHIKGGHSVREGDDGTFFWRCRFPNGVTQVFEETLFNPEYRDELRAAFNQAVEMINSAFKEGYYGVRIYSERESEV